MDNETLVQHLGNQLGSLSESAAEGIGKIVDEGARRDTPVNHLAYILATAWWETARTFAPVREAFFVASSFEKAEKWRRKNLHYYPYYGRGYVQLTWKANYQKASEKLGHDFVSNPDAVMERRYAIPIMFDGMYEGWFTGKALDDYIDEVDEPDSGDLAEYVAARKIINGTDKAKTIGNAALIFEAALKKAGYDTAASTREIGPAAAAGSRDWAGAATAAASNPFEQHIAALGLAHFKPYEFLVKGAANSNPHSPAHGLNTDPPQNLWNNINATARVVDKLRKTLDRPIVFSSVYRSPAYNAAIGGATKSQHVDFNAIDFSVKGSPVGPIEWAGALRDLRSGGLFAGGIGVYSTFVHVDTRGTNVDWTG